MNIFAVFKNRTVKVFTLLILSTIVVQLAAWALDWKFGENFYPLSSNSTTFTDLFNPSKDGGYFEHFQYILILWCSILSLLWVIINRYWKAIQIPFIYLFLFLDDSLLIHDGLAGNFIKDIYVSFNLFNQPYIRVKDFAEWTYWLVIFLILLIISIPSLNHISYEVRKFTKTNFLLFFSMSFFGLFIDLINANWVSWLIIPSKSLNFLVGLTLIILEECGEMFSIAIACIWLFSKVFKESPKQIKSTIE